MVRRNKGFQTSDGNFSSGGKRVGATVDSNLSFLFAVYTITWLAFFAYAFLMTRRQRDLRREIQELRRALEERKGR